MPAEVIFFNVGQGDCTLIVFHDGDPARGDSAVLVDAGSKKEVGHASSGGTDSKAKEENRKRVKAKIAGYLAGLKNPNTLDYVVVTHPDVDHYNLIPYMLLEDDESALKYTINNLLHVGTPAEHSTKRATKATTRDLLIPKSKYNAKIKKKEVVASPVKPRRLDLAGSGSGDAGLYVIAANTVCTKNEVTDAKKSRIDTTTTTISARRIPLAGWPGAAVRAGSDDEEELDLPAEAEDNRKSICLMLVGAAAGGKEQRVFLMADAGHEVEDVLTDKRNNARWTPKLKRTGNTWLKVGHHGSDTATYPKWLDHITPDGMFVSSGTLPFGVSGIPKFSHLKTIVQRWIDKKLPPVVVDPDPANPLLPDIAYYGDTTGELPRPKSALAAASEGAYYRLEGGIKGVATTLTRMPGKGRDKDSKALKISLGHDWHLGIDSKGPNTYSISYK
ncbi:MBL fold metallo-hydrolase [Streptomyces sp. NPDC048595]|uniref:MBL fold metallo-hydrolase n=1 Tax=Streptomyces sp. NPDC048595 TaxID=3365576 RepID=UPI003713844E